jgi:uncharacterized protein (DUF1800 family)
MRGLTPTVILPLLLAAGLCPAANFELELPEPDSPGDFTWLEWSTDLVKWTPVARDYGQDWQNTFPHALPLVEDGGSFTLIDAIDEAARFYRVRSADASGTTMSNEALAARFLQQSTFGPTRAAIQNFPGVESVSGFNDAPYTFFEAWIDSEIVKPVSSHRAFWRERSNPDFTGPEIDSPFPESPFEVANTEGHKIEYRVGATNFPVPGTDATNIGRNANDVDFSTRDVKRIVWYHKALTADDMLRQRVAWSLSQIFVIGELGAAQSNDTESYLAYYDIFVRHAFGNFRDILGEVTFSPRMGNYLTYLNNRKANPTTGSFPDENYAREVMQLFTIGLWELNMDGTRKLDGNNAFIPTYDTGDIEEFAKVFTGLRANTPRSNIEMSGSTNYIDPMRMQVSWHDYTAKTLLDGSTIGPYPETEQGAFDEINALLDHLFQHANTPPFIARLLIQRLTVSNPSPSYIQAVAEAFANGTYNGAGTGNRGDMTATIKAILLHPEAREPALSLDDAHGKLREPLIRLMHYARAFNVTSIQTHGFFPFNDTAEEMFQEPYNSPTVFNFYLSDHQPNGEIQERGIVAPEFEIHNDVTAIAFINALATLIDRGIEDNVGTRSYSQGALDYTYEISLADDSAALLDHLDLILTAGRLSPANRTEIQTVIDLMPTTDEEDLEDRVKIALWLFSMLPEFNVIY